MHQLLCLKSKFPNHFVFTLGRYLFLLFGRLYLMWMLTIVFYIYIYLYPVNYSCSLKCIEKNSYLTIVILAVVNFLFQKFQVIND